MDGLVAMILVVWRWLAWCAHLDVTQLFWGPEIWKLDSPLGVDQQVGTLQVPVYDVLGVQVVQPIEYLVHIGPHKVQIVLECVKLGDEIFDWAPRNPLKYDVYLIVIHLAGLNILHNIGMVQFFQVRDLVLNLFKLMLSLKVAQFSW